MTRSEILDHYLRSLSLERRAPDLEFLADICSRHVARFAFSSVGAQLGDELPLDLASLYMRLVVRGRGGYCFEQNGFAFEMLDELGFDVALYLARVIHDQDIHPGLTHRITVVRIGSARYVVDVGFGALGPRAPVWLPDAATGAPPPAAARSFRVEERQPGEFHLQTLKDGRFYSLYKFDQARYGQADCELGHFFSHKHPDAAFVRNLVASRIMESEVRSLRNREYWVITASGSERRDVTDPAQLREILFDAFDVWVTEAESRKLFERLPS